MNALLGNLAVQAESSFGGSGTGSIYHVAGIREFEHTPEFFNRRQKVGVWRQDNEQSTPQRSYAGRLDLDGCATASTDLLLAAFFDRRLTESVVAGTRNVYRPVRAGAPLLPSLKLFGIYEAGKWLRFDGVAIASLRFTVSAQQIVRISANWVAASMVQFDTDPAWNILNPSFDPLTGVDAETTINETPATELVEVSFEFSQAKITSNFNRFGVATKVSRTGQSEITGSILEFLSDTDLQKKARDGEEIALALTVGSGKQIGVNFPRAKLQGGSASPIGEGDVSENVPFRVLQDSDLDTAAEVSLEIVF